MHLAIKSKNLKGRVTSFVVENAKRDKNLKAKLQEIVKQNGTELNRNIQKITPVDTGNLRRSITLELNNNGLIAKVYTKVPYAKFVEYGTIHQKAQPYFRPPFRVQKARFKKQITQLFKE